MSRTCVLLCVLIGLAGSSINFSQTPKSTRALTPLGSLSGRVVTSGNVPVAGVQVSVPRRGATTTTNSNGEFVFPTLSLSPYQRLSVNFNAAGYMKTTRVYNVNRDGRIGIGPDVIVIWPRAASLPLDATLGGVLSFSGGAITFPPNSLVDEQGVPAQGIVNVSFTRLDVSDPVQLRSAPGDFTARMQNGVIRKLESFGVFEVSAEGSGGQRLELAPGQNAAIKLIIPPTRLPFAPKVVGFYSFDPIDGLWIEEGTVNRAQDNGLMYSGTIDRFDWSWNVDDPYDTTCITVKFIDVFGSNAGPIANALVEAKGVAYGSISSGYTNNQGLVCLLVKINSEIEITAYDPLFPSFPFTKTLFSPNFSSGADDCGDSVLCPLVWTFQQDARLPVHQIAPTDSKEILPGNG
jgi:hypothetical protein